MLSLIGLIICSQLDHFDFATINSPQVAGDSFQITVYAHNASHVIVDTFNGPATLFTSPGIQYGNKTITFNSGVWQGHFKATLADTYTIRCQDYSTPPHTGQSNSVVFDPNIAYRLLTILPGQTYCPGIETGKSDSSTIPQQVGSFFNVTFYLTDRWCNRVPGTSDSIRCLSTDQFRPFIDLRLADGSSNILYAFRTAGNHRIYTRDLEVTTIKSDTTSLINGYTGSYSRLLVLFPGETQLAGDTTLIYAQTPGKTGTPTPQYVLEDFTVIVYATDTMWNKTTTSGNAIALNSSFPFSNPPPQNLINGETQFTLNFSTRGDNQNLFAQDLSNGIQSYTNYITIEAKTTTINSAIDPDTVTPGQIANITAMVYDRTGAPIKGKEVRFSVLSGNGEINGDAVVYTDSSGWCLSQFICQSGFFNELDMIGITADDYTDSSTVVYVRIPDSTVMGGNLVAFPNPFGPINVGRQTQFMYYLSSNCNVIYAIYDPFGNLVHHEDIAPGQNGARQGINVITWDGRNDKHKRVASGVYYVIFKGYFHTNVFLEKRIKVGVIW